jgi:hypothetical protein
MTDPYRQILPEHPGKGRLGRHVEFDPHSRDYEYVSTVARPRTQLWTRRSPIFDQGNLGSCTGNAVAGCLATDSSKGQGHDDLTEDDALALYEAATRLDGFPGAYPPDDVGSSGNAACKAAKRAGLISGYHWAFSLSGLVNALQVGPAAIGINWLRGCDHPDASGLVKYSGPSRGGHEISVIGVSLERGQFRIANSWGTGWGDSGYFSMTISDMTRALADKGDVSVPLYE